MNAFKNFTGRARDWLICAACACAFLIWVLFMWPFVAAADRRKEIEG